ncbi:hypothetical protein GBA65_11270 [Rubrobacter marinus]|uniref:Uncharacterized protein n=1 Tax=Rubrobacter marinus TaxID=2653852 RepID=A0A6G8PXT4_9ACTN|nr:hypothetical protein [Rubrobacter marinus]QIN79006.1 hypothetical protein GBA65_11270 [Rubrobacter marinus]
MSQTTPRIVRDRRVLTRGIRFALASCAVLLVLALALYILLREYNAPQSVLFGLLDLFVVTFASLVLTFFTGALLYDYQLERAQEENARLVARLLRTELSGLLRLLDEANAVEVRLSGTGETLAVVPSRLETLILTDATRGGFFDPEGAAVAMRLLGNVAARRVLVHDLLLPRLLSDEPEVPRALVRRIEDLRWAIVRDLTALQGLVAESP